MKSEAMIYGLVGTAPIIKEDALKLIRAAAITCKKALEISPLAKDDIMLDCLRAVDLAIEGDTSKLIEAGKNVDHLGTATTINGPSDESGLIEMFGMLYSGSYGLLTPQEKPSYTQGAALALGTVISMMGPQIIKASAGEKFDSIISDLGEKIDAIIG